MKPKTEQEVKQEIENLKQLRKTLDISWHPVLDAQIFVLENNLDKKQVLDKFENPETSERVLNLALYAYKWLNGTADPMMLLREIGYSRSLANFKDDLKDDFETEFDDEGDEYQTAQRKTLLKMWTPKKTSVF